MSDKSGWYFLMENFFWKILRNFKGIRLNDIVQMATEKENIEPEYSL